MDTYDIRRSHDIKGDGRRTATAILNGRPPSSKDIAASPGLACLIVVLRRVYAFLLHHPGALPFLDWMKSSEKANPILRVAWNSFGDEPDEVEQATISMNNLAEALSSMGFSPNESFYTLCESLLMKNTFWSHPGIRVVCPPTQSNMGNQDVVGSYLHADLPEFHPAQTPGHTLQVFANGFLEATTARPPIIRILYDSDSKQPIDFNGLRSFVPPVSSHDARLCFAGRDKEYVVLAIVRLNDTNNKNDYVRTYSIYGPNIIAEYEPPSFMAHRWSVKDAPVKYILIYGLHEQWPDDLTDFASLPEIATHPVSQENFVNFAFEPMQTSDREPDLTRNTKHELHRGCRFSQQGSNLKILTDPQIPQISFNCSTLRFDNHQQEFRFVSRKPVLSDPKGSVLAADQDSVTFRTQGA